MTESAELNEFLFEGRSIQYRFAPSAKPGAPLLVMFHGNTVNPRPSSYRNGNWNILCPVDNYGYNGAGTWYLGENGDFFWLRAMPALIRKVYGGEYVCFAGSSMGGYAAILHGIRHKAKAVYANIPQTTLLGSTYAAQGMKKCFDIIFGAAIDADYNDLRNQLSDDIKTLFIITGNQFDKANYVQEQYLPFIGKLIDLNIRVHFELRPEEGHKLTYSFVQAVELIERYLEEAAAQNP